MEGNFNDVVDKHQPETRVVCIALGNMLQREVDLLYVIGEKSKHQSHKIAKVEDVIDDIRVLLNDVGKCF